MISKVASYYTIKGSKCMHRVRVVFCGEGFKVSKGVWKVMHTTWGQQLPQTIDIYTSNYDWTYLNEVKILLQRELQWQKKQKICQNMHFWGSKVKFFNKLLKINSWSEFFPFIDRFFQASKGIAGSYSPFCFWDTQDGILNIKKWSLKND